MSPYLLDSFSLASFSPCKYFFLELAPFFLSLFFFFADCDNLPSQLWTMEAGARDSCLLFSVRYSVGWFVSSK